MDWIGTFLAELEPNVIFRIFLSKTLLQNTNLGSSLPERNVEKTVALRALSSASWVLVDALERFG
jgi:hypothetical protein